MAARIVFSRVDLYLDPGLQTQLQAARVVVYANHPGFWDPLMLALLTERLWPDHAVISPIDEAGLRTHRYFHGLGFFAIDPASVSGLRKFAQIASAAWEAPLSNCLVVLPEGRFSPPGPLRLRRGLARALSAHQGPPPVVVPVAISYRMGENPRPVAALAVGQPLSQTTGSLPFLHQGLEEGLLATLGNLEDCLRDDRPSTSLVVSPCR
jgi:1-acyl-sn-glycerol-3-phosphate acyltransferase